MMYATYSQMTQKKCVCMCMCVEGKNDERNVVMLKYW